MSPDREAEFLRHVERQKPYFTAIEEAGDLAWFKVGNPKRDGWIERLELPADISEMDLRRAVFMRRFK